MDKWIPIEERLPEEYGCYIVAYLPTNMTEEQCYKLSHAPHFYGIVEFTNDNHDISDFEVGNSIELSASVLKELHDLYEDLTWRGREHLQLKEV